MARVLILISLRNLVAHKATSLIVGSIILFGTFLLVLGTSMLDTIDRSMAKSVTSSLAGHLQVYSADARDQLNLFGGGFMGGDDVGIMPDFGKVRARIEAVPNVAAVVPMGLRTGLVFQGNEIDRTVAALRRAAAEGDNAQEAALQQKLKNVAADLSADLTNQLPISADQGRLRKGLEDLELVRSAAFWEGYPKDKQKWLLFLDTNLAPLSADGRMLYLRNLGTDLHRFAELFDRFEIVDGEMVPPGERGLLLSKRFYEERIKNRVARELDRIDREKNEVGKKIAKDIALAGRAERLPRQYSGIKNQLSATDALNLEAELKRLLPGVDGGLNELLQAFLTVDDQSFDARYRFFYDRIASMIQLYPIAVGDQIVIRAVTKGGYFKAIEIKIWGTYQFKSLEESALAGAQNLIDMQSFRELFGVMTADKRAELEAIKQEVGIAEVSRADAEAAFFGGGDTVGDVEVEDDAAEAFFDADFAVAAEETGARRYTQADIDRGLAVNAAVLLVDPERLWETKAAIEQMIAAEGLGLKVIDWQTASGMVGQLIYVLRAVLYIAIFIIFIVAIVIINNSMVMATLERVGEIGTMRAIGAGRPFIVYMLLVETSILGLIAGTLGTIAGAVGVTIIGRVGIPAVHQFLIFLFSGPRLYPTFGLGNLIFAFVVILLVSLAATFWPARIAVGIQPVVAMQAKE